VPYRVVLADASLSVQKAIQLALPEPDFRLYVFEDGVACLNALPEIKPDAVLLSLGLPGRDGYDIGRFIKARDEYRRVPVLLLRGTFEPLEEERLHGVDYKGIIQKPFDSEKLAVTVRELIEREISPATLPEEHALGLPATPERRQGNGAKAEPSGFDTRVRDIVREEVLAAEREVEKRVRARVLQDVRELVGSAPAGPKSDKNP
jgi:DNA-binding response OmpR family regulator